MGACPYCGADNRSGVRFCRQCGKPLGETGPARAASPTCARCGTPLRPDARFCKQCGSPVAPAHPGGPTCPRCDQPVRPRAAFCPHCGARLTRPAAKRVCPRCRAQVRATARFCPICRTPLVPASTAPTGPRCPNCDTPIRPGARFCYICSRPLGPSQPSPSRRPPSQQRGRFGTGDLLPLITLTDRYVILEKIAQGGMGAVYKAQDRRIQDRIVAVKEMSESAIAPAERKRVLECFQREAELLARLEHPNLVRVTDRFQEEKRHYMVIEFIDGQTLEEMLAGRTEPFPEELVLAWADQLCDVLSYLHSQRPKIIYRDVKPANVMVLEGTDTVKLIDFGIARFFKPGKRKDTIELGTDGYAPPEQYGKSQTDERADVYALGAVLHQLLTLRDPVTVPFQFPHVRSLNPKVSRRVERAIAKAVEASRERRHPSVEEMRMALLGEDAARLRSLPTEEEVRKPAGLTRPSTAPPLVTGPLLPTPALVDFGNVAIGGGAPDQPLKVVVPAGERVTLSTDVPWLQVHPRSISKHSDQVVVTVDTGRLEAGRLALEGGWLKRWAGWHTHLLVPAEQQAHGYIEIESDSGHTRRVPVSVTVVPRRQQVQMGWVVTIGALLLEVAAVVGAVVALIP
jgi:serine/threonine protein kinase